MVERLRKARRFVEEAEAARDAVPGRAAPSLAQDAVVAALNPDDGKIWNNAAFAVPAALLVEAEAPAGLTRLDPAATMAQLGAEAGLTLAAAAALPL